VICQALTFHIVGLLAQNCVPSCLTQEDVLGVLPVLCLSLGYTYVLVGADTAVRVEVPATELTVEVVLPL
jgi:hypothetical protein